MVVFVQNCCASMKYYYVSILIKFYLLQDELVEYGMSQVYLAVWTTTPWSLPANEAICFAPDENYVLAKVNLSEQVIALIWAEELLHELKDIFSQNVTHLSSFEGK